MKKTTMLMFAVLSVLLLAACFNDSGDEGTFTVTIGGGLNGRAVMGGGGTH